MTVKREHPKTMIKANLVFEFIVNYKKKHDGNSPKLRLIQRECGISSTSVLDLYLDRLEKHGKIERTGEIGSRQIEVVGGEWTYESN
jgi:hypothetical protein